MFPNCSLAEGAMFEKLRREWHLRDIDNRIRRNGCTFIYVGDFQTSPCWTYSLGFEETLRQPEVILFDASREDANAVLYLAYKSLEAGRLEMKAVSYTHLT